MTEKRRKKIPLTPILALVPFVVIATLYLILPLINLAVDGFMAPGTRQFSVENYAAVFTKPVYLASIRNSLRISLASTVIGLLISFFTAMALTQVSERFNNSMMSILSMTSNFAGLPLAFAFIVMLGNSGVIMAILQSGGLHLLDGFNLYSYDGLLIMFIYFQIPLGTMLLVPAFTGIRKAWREAAVLLRANSFQFWSRVGIPMLLPGLTGTFGMLFANAFTAYATVFMLMTTNYALLPIKVTQLFIGDATVQAELGSALSIVMIIILLMVIGLCNLINKLFYKGGEIK